MPSALARPDALRTYADIRAGSQVGKLLALYQNAAARNVEDTQGRRWQGLTDREAAVWLGVGRSSINGARNELVRRGLVGKLRRRQCRADQGRDVWAWALATLCPPAE